MIITVVIPSYNRKNILVQCLNALFEQTYPKKDFEIILIDDGSTDGTDVIVNKIKEKSPIKLKYFKQKNKGPAAARNIGIQNASGKVVLFIGDDIIASPTLLEEHSKWHRQYQEENVAVLGYVTWSHLLSITPFMHWLEESGVQFYYTSIKDNVEVDPQNYFYTSNISVKKDFLVDNGFFDEIFRYAAYEDIELGGRLKKKGLILKYNKNAIVYHDHYTSIDDACKRMIKVGESSCILSAKKGEKVHLVYKSILKKIFARMKGYIYYHLAEFYEKKAVKGNIFKYLMGYYLNLGIEKYMREHK